MIFIWDSDRQNNECRADKKIQADTKLNSIQFYLYSAFNKGALSQSCFTENRPLMSKPRATVARKNSLADNRKKSWAEPDSEGNHLPLVGTGFNPIYWVHFESSHVGMRWQVTVAGGGCPVGLGWISGPEGEVWGLGLELQAGDRWSNRAWKTEVPACDNETLVE